MGLHRQRHKRGGGGGGGTAAVMVLFVVLALAVVAVLVYLLLHPKGAPTINIGVSNQVKNTNTVSAGAQAGGESSSPCLNP